MTDTLYKRLKLIEICLFFCVCFVSAATLDITNAPDEAMRYPIAQYIYTNGTLPNGMEDSLINDIWGFSYALYPYLTSIISAFFMKITSFFAASEASLLITARLTSVFAGTGTIILCFKIGEQLFRERHFSLLMPTLVCFLPQFVFLCSYQNNDSFAVFCSALIIYFWIRALKTDWSRSSCIGLGVGCGLCSLSYYNAYVYILATIILYFFYRIIKKESSVNIIGGALIIFLVAFAIGGWFFIRNASLHNGDILGMATTTQSAEIFAMDGYKPSQIDTPKKLGLGIMQTFFSTNGYNNSAWLPTVAGSFIGCFANMTAQLPLFLYALYFILLLVGFFGMISRRFLKPGCRSSLNINLRICFIGVIIINVLLFMYSAYTKDYQAQGRYLMPSLLPLMLFITDGYRIISLKIARKSTDPAMTKEERAETIKRTGMTLSLTVASIYLVFFLISYFAYLLPSCPAAS